MQTLKVAPMANRTIKAAGRRNITPEEKEKIKEMLRSLTVREVARLMSRSLDTVRKIADPSLAKKPEPKPQGEYFDYADFKGGII